MQNFSTAAAADAYIRRQSLWSRLRDLFHHSRPNEDQLHRVSSVAEVAIDQVFAAHRLTPDQQQDRHGQVKDYAECAALYSYVIGYNDGKQEALNAIQPHATPPAFLGQGD